MRSSLWLVTIGALTLTLMTAGCGGINFGEARTANVDEGTLRQRASVPIFGAEDRATIFDLFDGGADTNTTVEVNRYLWSASQQILDFLPVQAVDPFSGIIVYGYGTPPGGGRAYRATVYIQDPALDARSLNVALATRSGPASPDTVRAVEDAILTRARQLRIRDTGF